METGDQGTVIELLQWLRAEEDSGKWKVREINSPASDHMGASAILEVILDSAGLLALIRSLHVWIKYRQPHVVITVRSSSGSEIAVDATNAGDASTIVDRLKAQ
jgi:hypothetical protein